MRNIIKQNQHIIEPSWRPHGRVLKSRIPAELLSWLLDPASLTYRLKQACAGKFAVQVLSQAWERPMRNEADALNMKNSALGFVRQVKLLCDGQPWVFARTVIPRPTIRGPQGRLIHLGNKPLGEVLFADKTMQRGEVELACIRPGQHLYELALDGQSVLPRSIWGRRSVFYLSNKPLLVSEIFLPHIKSFTKEHS